MYAGMQEHQMYKGFQRQNRYSNEFVRYIMNLRIESLGIDKKLTFGSAVFIYWRRYKTQTNAGVPAHSEAPLDEYWSQI